MHSQADLPKRAGRCPQIDSPARLNLICGLIITGRRMPNKKTLILEGRRRGGRGGGGKQEVSLVDHSNQLFVARHRQHVITFACCFRQHVKLSQASSAQTTFPRRRMLAVREQAASPSVSASLRASSRQRASSSSTDQQTDLDFAASAA